MAMMRALTSKVIRASLADTVVFSPAKEAATSEVGLGSLEPGGQLTPEVDVKGVVIGEEPESWQKDCKKTAEIIDGKHHAGLLRQSLRLQVLAADSKPGLGYIQVGSRRDSTLYIRMKKRACEDVGIEHYGIQLKESAQTHEIIQAVRRLNEDPNVHGILVQLPFPAHVDKRAVIESIRPDKDVDGITLANMGKLFHRDLTPLFYPCTPLGCLHLLRAYQVPIDGARAVVIGRSIIVGAPAAAMLQNENATVTVCHTHTHALSSILSEADIVFSAVGKPNLVKAHMLKPGCTLIDVGISSIEDGSNKKIVGDCDFEACRQVAGKISPVPGGVGPMTVAMLMSNTIASWKRTLK